MQYARAKWKECQNTLAYRIYVTESLRLSVENKYLISTYLEMIYPKPKDERTGNEIASDIITRLGLKME